MEEQQKINKRLNIKIPPEILSNKGLSINEKLIFALDYTLSLKKGYTIFTNVDIGKILSLHSNILGLCRKSLIAKEYLIKDAKDKRIHVLTDKLKKVELPLINGKIDKRECVIPFEIYNHPDLQTGAKLLWGEYNSMSKTENGYFSKRTTTSKRMNTSIGSITNWTKELYQHGLLAEYTIDSGYFTKQKTVRTVEFKREIEKPVDEVGDFLDDEIRNDLSIEEVSSILLPIEEKADLEIEKKEELKEHLWDSPSLPLGGITMFSDLPIGKKKDKNKYNDVIDEDPNLEII